MVRACEKVNRSSPRPRARTPRPRSNSTWSLFRKAIGRAKRIASIKPRAAVLKSENREWASPAENRALAHVDWLREGPEGPTLRLTQDSLAEGIDRHLRLFLGLPHADVQGPPAGLFLSDDHDVRDPLLLCVADLLPEGVAGIIEVDPDTREVRQQGSRKFEIVLGHWHNSHLGWGKPDGQHGGLSRLHRRGGLLEQGVDHPFDRAAR